MNAILSPERIVYRVEHMKTKTRRGVNRRLYGFEKSARSREQPNPRYYVRMRLVKNFLWMLFIVLLLAGLVNVLFMHTAVRGSGDEAGFSRDAVEAREY